MQKYIVITIDVEPDCSLSWRYSNPIAFTGVSIGIKERLQPLFNKYNFTPTYLINNVVLENDESIKIFQELEGNFELATHLHPEFIEPEKLYFNYSNILPHANQCSFTEEVEFEKLRNITELFTQNFGIKPLSFRAGRFNASANTITSLAKLGYKVDTSVTPHVKWQDNTFTYPVNYSAAYEQPYFVKKGSLLEADKFANILEVPVSIFKRKFFNKITWLRPHMSTYKDFIKVITNYSKIYEGKNYLVFNMMFHNVEVLPNISPYTKTETECEKYLNDLELFLQFCISNEIKSVELCELFHIYRNL